MILVISVGIFGTVIPLRFEKASGDDRSIKDFLIADVCKYISEVEKMQEKVNNVEGGSTLSEGERNELNYFFKKCGRENDNIFSQLRKSFPNGAEAICGSVKAAHMAYYEGTTYGNGS